MGKFADKMLELGKGLKNVIRGLQGLPPEGEDTFAGMINVKDIRERTRLPSQHDVYAHSYLRLLSQAGGSEWKICKDIAEMEEHLLISLEGEQRKEAILMQKAKTEVRIPGQPLELQKVQTKREQIEAEKGKEAKKDE